MGLKVGKSSNEDLYISEITILEAIDTSDEVIEWTDSWGTTQRRKWDLAVTIKWEIEKQSGDIFDWQLAIRGNLKRDEGGTVTGWGAAYYSVLGLFQAAEAVSEDDALNDDETIPKEWLQRLVGKKVKVLRYRLNSGKYADAREVYSAKMSDKAIKQKFINTWKQKGFPRDFTPLHLDESSETTVSAPPADVDFGTGTTPESTGSTASPTVVDESVSDIDFDDADFEAL